MPKDELTQGPNKALPKSHIVESGPSGWQGPQIRPHILMIPESVITCCVCDKQTQIYAAEEKQFSGCPNFLSVAVIKHFSEKHFLEGLEGQIARGVRTLVKNTLPSWGRTEGPKVDANTTGRLTESIDLDSWKLSESKPSTKEQTWDGSSPLPPHPPLPQHICSSQAAHPSWLPCLASVGESVPNLAET